MDQGDKNQKGHGVAIAVIMWFIYVFWHDHAVKKQERDGTPVEETMGFGRKLIFAVTWGIVIFGVLAMWPIFSFIFSYDFFKILLAGAWSVIWFIVYFGSLGTIELPI